MRVIWNIALWVVGLFAVLIGVCLFIGVDTDRMLWTIASMPIGAGICYVGYRLMVLSGFEKPIEDEEV